MIGGWYWWWIAGHPAVKHSWSETANMVHWVASSLVLLRIEDKSLFGGMVNVQNVEIGNSKCKNREIPKFEKYKFDF